MNTITRANEYIEQNQRTSNNQPGYHFCAPIGWINDPNGFSWFKDFYHLFNQYYPYDTVWGLMHWGHARTKDLIKWEHLPVALAPDQSYDAQGCYSGSAIVHEDKLMLMYTGHLDPYFGKTVNRHLVRENQNIAWTRDGIHFEKYENNPVLEEKHLPEGCLVQDFRDPKVYRYGEYFYSVLVSRHETEGGQALLYRSKDMLEWEFFSTLHQSKYQLGTMWECPDFSELSGKDILLISTMHEDVTIGSKHRKRYLIGKMNYDLKQYQCEADHELDCGFSFYAPQTMIDDQGRRIMIAWLNSWHAKSQTSDYGWTGMMTVPRELKLINNRIYQYPVEELKKYRIDKIEYKNIKFQGLLSLEGIHGKQIDFEAELDLSEAKKITLQLCKGKVCQTTLSYNCMTNEFVFDRSLNGEAMKEPVNDENRHLYIRSKTVIIEDNCLKLRILIDLYSIELFINDGETVFTSTIFPDEDADQIQWIVDGEAMIRSIEKYRIEV